MKYLLAHEASRWTQSHYSQKAFEMINIESNRNFIAHISPEIRMDWEKKNNISLAASIARIEEIEQNKKKPGAKNNRLATMIFVIVLIAYIVMLLLWKNSVPIVMTLVVCMLVSAIHYAHYTIHTQRKFLEEGLKEVYEQDNLSASITSFRETILKVCEHNTLPKDRIVDAEYLKDVLHVAIKDLLFKKAEYGVRRKNTSISLDDVAPFAFKYVNSGEYLNKQCTIVEDELGVKLDMGKMFAKASEEMKRSYPGYKEFFKTKEVEDGGTEKQEG